MSRTIYFQRYFCIWRGIVKEKTDKGYIVEITDDLKFDWETESKTKGNYQIEVMHNEVING